MTRDDLSPFLLELQRRLETCDLRGLTVDLGYGSQSAEVQAEVLLEAVRRFRALLPYQRLNPVMRQDQERLAADIRRLWHALQQEPREDASTMPQPDDGQPARGE